MTLLKYVSWNEATGCFRHVARRQGIVSSCNKTVRPLTSPFSLSGFLWGRAQTLAVLLSYTFMSHEPRCQVL
jgi:hypothetical protein